MWIPEFIIQIFAKKFKQQLNLQGGQMDNSKPWYQSQTIWAGVVTGLRGIYIVLQTSVLPAFNVHLPPIPPVADAVLGTVLGATVVHGRWTADSVIQ